MTTRYFAVVVVDGEVPLSHAFEDRPALEDFLRTLPQEGAYVFLFEGRKLLVTRGPRRFLIDGGEMISLEPGPETLTDELAHDGRLGNDPAQVDAEYKELTDEAASS